MPDLTLPGDLPLPRIASQRVERAMLVNPVVVIMGARQTGKSTLAREVARADGRRYLTFDDASVREQAAREPATLLASDTPLLIDEVQRVPDFLLALKMAVDEMGTRRRMGHYLVTGSANPLTMKAVADSLAGRASYVPLHPMTRRETLGMGECGIWSQLFDTPPARWASLLEGQGVPEEPWRERCRIGGFPVPALALDDEARDQWFGDYEITYLDRDTRDITNIQNVPDFRRLMALLALRIGNLTNQTEVGRDAQLGQAQVHRWLNLLETTFQLHRLSAFGRNAGVRLIKTPKLYWIDTALALHLTREREPRGAHLENLVCNDLLAWRDALAPRANLAYWRTAGGREVDFIVEHEGRVLAVEVKGSATVSRGDATHLEAFIEAHDQLVHGALVLYAGRQTLPLGDRILAAPWWQVL